MRDGVLRRSSADDNRPPTRWHPDERNPHATPDERTRVSLRGARSLRPRARAGRAAATAATTMAARATSGSGSGSDDGRAATAAGGGFEIDTVELRDRPDQRRDHRRHDQVRHQPAAVGHLRRVRGDPAGRAGVLRLPQRREGRRRHRAARSTRSSSSPRTTPTTPQTTLLERADARRRRRRLRPLQRRRHEEQPRDPRLRERRTASRTCSRRPVRRRGATPTTRGCSARCSCRTRSRCRRSSTTSKTNKPDATIAMLRADDDFGASYSETLKSLIEGTDLTIADEETYDPETGEVDDADHEPRGDATPTCSCSARRCSRARRR